MMKSWIIQAAISFVIRQLAKWQARVDWAKVKADLTVRIKDLVPGEFFDSEAVALSMAVIDAVAAALSATEDLEQISKLLLDQKFQEAWVVLRDLILKVWQPKVPVEHKVMAFIKDCETIAA